MQKKILIAGGSGLIGRRLTQLLLQQHYEVGWLSRGKSGRPGVKLFYWDLENGELDAEAIKWADTIIHLAGEGIADKRWTKKRKQKIISSRVDGITLIRNCMQQNAHHITCVIAGSAVGYYGDRGNALVNEGSGAGSGFLSTSVTQWENAISTFSDAGVRLITLRTGVVLSVKGGALKELKKTLPLGIAPVLGNGKQYMPWIHLDDACGFILHALQNDNISGTINMCASAATQKQVMQAIRKVFQPYSILAPVPVFALRILLGEMADTVLISQNVSNNKMLNTGYTLHYSDLHSALVQIKNSHT